MKIVDRSNGFWLNILTKRTSPEVAFEQNYMPDPTMTRLLGEEIISGMKGSTKHKFMVRHMNGKLVISRVPNGKYQTGILRRTSPDGTPYVPLSESTLAIRKIDGNTRGPAFILRETGKHIMDGLKIITSSFGRKRSKMSIGWTGEDAEIAAKQNKGFEEARPYRTSTDELRDFSVIIPARPFIGISEEVQTVLQQAWNKIGKV